MRLLPKEPPNITADTVRRVWTGVIALAVLVMLGTVIWLVLISEDLADQQAASRALADQVERLGAEPVVDPDKPPAAGTPGKQGEQGEPGDQGPAPTAEQVRAAVSDYCAGDRCKPTVSRSEVTAAVAAYCAGGACRGEPGVATDGTNGEDGEPGATGTTGATGATGPQGPGPTDEQVAAAVDAYCADGKCRGEKGETGNPGTPGADGKDATFTPSGMDCPEGERVNGVHLLADGSLTVSCPRSSGASSATDVGPRYPRDEARGSTFIPIIPGGIMAKPMTAAQWRAQLKKFGQKYRELPTFRDPESGRSSETGKEFGPVHGGLIHHTAGPDDKPNNADDAADSRVVNQGRTGLPGPLAHAGATDDGVIELHTTDRANHAGDGDRDVYNAVLDESYGSYPPRPDRDSVDGNDCFYGLEAYYTGTKPPKAAQYRAMVNWAAAFCDFHGWSAKSAIGHKEWTKRKIDPYGVDMAKFRRDVAARIKEVNAPAPKPATITSDISVTLANVRSTPLMKPAQAQADYEVAFKAAAKAGDQAVYINEFHTSYAAALDTVAKKYGYIVKKQGGLAVAYRRNKWALSGFAYSLITKGVSGITPNRGVLRVGNTTPAGTRVVFDCTMFPRGWKNPKYAKHNVTGPLGEKLAKAIAAIVKSQTGTLKSAALVGGDMNIGSLMNWSPYGVTPAAACMGSPDALDKMMQLHLFVPAGWTAKLVEVEMVPGDLNTDHGIVRAHFQVTRPR